jgi:O-methyltransferase
MNKNELITRAKAGDYYERPTLVYEKHLHWLWDYVATLDGGKMVEAGCARGGCLAVCHASNPKLNIIGLDSWEPMPEINPEKDDASKCNPWVGTLTCGEITDVKKNYNILGADDTNLTLLKGWLEDTIPANIELFDNLDILRIDTDHYNSIKFCLEHLYPKLKKGGLIIFDDWYFNPKGVQGAAHDYFQSINVPMPSYSEHTPSFGPTYFFKP